jgi:hypothetical protein
MRTLLVALAAAAWLIPSPAHAWGFEPHRFIMDRAIALLPPQIRPLFERERAMVVERAIDPDTWRTAGFRQEDPNHFLDLDSDAFGKFPYAGLPRDLTAALAKFGRARMEDAGYVPWRVEEMHGNLRRAFESYGRGTVFARHDVLAFSAWLSHYVSDAHQPFHNVVNYDGQLTGQNGIHARFETALFERFRARLTIDPTPIPPIAAPRDFIFDKIVEGTQLVPPILKSDLDAIGTRDLYDDMYFAAFFTSNRPVLERRLNESIAAVAAMIAGAWEAAGRPAVPADPPPPPPARRRR